MSDPRWHTAGGRPTWLLPVWALYERVAMHLGLGMLALICLCWLPFALLLHPLLPPTWGRPLGRRAIAWGFRTYLRGLSWLCACRFDLTALDGLAQQGPALVVANHPSLLDAVLITSRLPYAVCVMKSSLMDNPLFGSAARLAGYVRNDVPLRMVLQSRDVLGAGGQVVIFPEGSRTERFPMDRCLPTIGLMAQRCGAPVQTLLIEFSTPYLGKSWPLFKPPTLPLTCRVRLGQRFAAPLDAAAFTQELQAYFQSALVPASAAGTRPPSP